MNEQVYLSLQKVINQQVLKAFVYSGYKNYQSEDISVITEACLKWLETNGKGLDEEDVSKAIEMGSLGELGQYTGISAITVIQWIKAWKYSPKRFQSKRKIEPTHQLTEKAPLSVEEQRDADLAWLEKAKNTPNYKDYGHILYKALYRLGYLKNDLEEIEHAAAAVREDKINEGRHKVAMMKMGSGQLMELIGEVNQTPAEKFKSEIRHKRVEWYLQK
jgi:DNA-directed RNA polymerase specialized sigma54-like protein